MLVIVVLEGGMMRRRAIEWADGDELPPQLPPEELEPNLEQQAFHEDMEFLDRLTDDDRRFLRSKGINPNR